MAFKLLNAANYTLSECIKTVIHEQKIITYLHQKFVNSGTIISFITQPVKTCA